MTNEVQALRRWLQVLKGHSFSCAVSRMGGFGLQPLRDLISMGNGPSVAKAGLWGSLHGTPEGVPFQSSPPRCHRFLRINAVLLIAVLLTVSNTSAFADSAPASQPPDAIFLNGDIYTQATPARAQAMAVRDGHIVAVGTNDDIRKLKGSHTQVVDLGGHFVMPGFNDAHVHLAGGGFELAERRSARYAARCRRCSSASRPRQNRGSRRVDRRPRLGPHAVDGRQAAHPSGHRRGHRRASRRSSAAWTATLPSPTLRR